MSEEKNCMDNVMESAGKLRTEISSVRSDYSDILDSIEIAKKKKTEAKESYDRCIDAGDEAGMKGCLRAIRGCNETIEGLPASREIFYGKISGLDARQNILIEKARENVKEVQKVLDRAERDLEKAKEESERCRAISSEIGLLRNIIAKSGVASSDEKEVGI